MGSAQSGRRRADGSPPQPRAVPRPPVRKKRGSGIFVSCRLENGCVVKLALNDLESAKGEHIVKRRRATFLPGVSPAYDAYVESLAEAQRVRLDTKRLNEAAVEEERLQKIRDKVAACRARQKSER